jgi:hypothetical protein
VQEHRAAETKGRMKGIHMDTLTVYQSGFGLSIPVRGQQLRRKKWQLHEREFWAAALHRGSKHLVKPTIAQTVFLAGAGSVTSVWWALQRETERGEIMRGRLPLVPPQRVAKAPFSDPEIFHFVRTVGVARVLDAACAVEAAE